jgi:hypothetical protein
MADGHTDRAAVQSRRGRRRTTLVEDATAVLQSVVNEVVPGVIDVLDIEAIVERIDLNALLEQVDLNELLDGIDLDKLLDRLDLNALLERVDIEALLQRTELGTLVSRATGGVVADAVDGMRSAGVGLDGFVQRWVDRLLRRSQPNASSPADQGAAP